ncbi:hypothetical protein GCM10011506_34000 [Marivirga lumbricoides]|uniref:Outer membrane protein beta-barrel domain-containing protein n=1 Tax=Marivirga lumbricoides TaxID=1046115 RepID=A0A2T4DJA6_9BACT|nr:hypothetical protein C9994_12590 [Marivirga lumbricoides]GGC45590.1 hypothetical protein GCM10011506_34000 [Marivirga lumbricoides]
MRFIIVTFILFQFSTLSVHSQKYGTAVGIRFGDNQFGVSVRQQFYKRFTGEALLEVSANEFTATILPKYHLPILGKGLNFYVGAGAHLGTLKDYGATVGVDLMAGIEMKVPALPVTVSADFKPAYHFRHEDWFDFPVAVSVHYIISKETREKRKKAREKRKRKRERRERREERRENGKDWKGWVNSLFEEDQEDRQ